MFKNILKISILSLLISSCTSDININDEWKDITVVYSLLNGNENTHYVRVQKAYLGTDDVLMMAAETDSIYYTDSLTVELQKLNDNGGIISRVVLEPVLVDKEEGVFTSEGHYVYRTPASFDQNLDKDKNYKVFITNHNTNKEVYATTSLIGDHSLSKPFQNPNGINFNATNELKIEWYEAENAAVYQPYFRFHYYENGEAKFVEWNYAEMVNKSIEVNMRNCYSYLANLIEPSESAERVLHKDSLHFEIIIVSAGEEYVLYSDVNNSSGSIVEERPEYSNVENGLGIVSTRSNINTMYKIHEDTIDSLVCGSKTSGLHFGEVAINLATNQLDTTYCAF